MAETQSNLTQLAQQRPSGRGSFKNLTGMEFGYLVVVSEAFTRGSHVHWLCQCRCGREVTVRGTSLNVSQTRSCGCLAIEGTIARSTTHGCCNRTPEYSAWRSLLKRCYSQSDRGYKNYGRRGITVCDRWRTSFENFLSDVGERPGSQYSIDRINNDGNYEPTNCRWATSSQQARNRRSTKMLTHDEITLCLTDWAKKIGIAKDTLWRRLKSGWSVEKALTTPKGGCGLQ